MEKPCTAFCRETGGFPWRKTGLYRAVSFEVRRLPWVSARGRVEMKKSRFRDPCHTCPAFWGRTVCDALRAKRLVGFCATHLPVLPALSGHLPSEGPRGAREAPERLPAKQGGGASQTNLKNSGNTFHENHFMKIL